MYERDYLENVVRKFDRIPPQKKQIIQAASIMADAVLSGGKVYIYDRKRALMIDANTRASGLAITSNYYNPNNSYLPFVLDTGLGIPITLSLVYKLVATRLGLRAEGVNAPGHFLVQVAGGSKPMLIDPFRGGQLLSREEAFRRMDEAAGRSVARSEYYLMPATHRQWLARMLRNLAHIFSEGSQSEELAAMTELGQLLGVSVL